MSFVDVVYVVLYGESQLNTDEGRELLELRTRHGANRIAIVYHQAMGLPARLFNSNAIELKLHLIPGLKDTFIYFNDDCFVCRPSMIQDWITTHGRIRYLKDWDGMPAGSRKDDYAVSMRRTFKTVMAKLTLDNMDDFKIVHGPVVNLKHVWREVNQMFPDEIKATLPLTNPSSTMSRRGNFTNLVPGLFYSHYNLVGQYSM